MWKDKKNADSCWEYTLIHSANVSLLKTKEKVCHHLVFGFFVVVFFGWFVFGFIFVHIFDVMAHFQSTKAAYNPTQLQL